jgi:predicted nucleic acid-binding protein
MSATSEPAGPLAFPWLSTQDDDLRRALAVHALRADAGHHPVPWPALVVAAVAERHQVAVLHYDPTFPLIAKVTGQNVEWVVPDGSLP